MLKILISIGSLQFAAMAVLLLRTKFLALLLGPDQFGLMATLDRLVAVFAQTASLSLPFAALRYLSPLWEEHKSLYVDLWRRMRNVMAATIVAALAIAGALLLFSPNVLGVSTDQSRVLAAWALAGLPVIAFVPFLQNTIASAFAHNRAMLFMVLHAIVFTAASITGTFFWGLPGLYGVYAAAGVVFIAIALRKVSQAHRDRPGPFHRSRETAPPSGSMSGRGRVEGSSPVPLPEYGPGIRGYLPPHVWRFCLLVLPMTFLAPAVAYVVFYLVLRVHGDQTVGYMQAGIGISLAIRMILGAAGQVFLTPLVNRDGHFSERLDRANRFQKVLLLASGIAVPPVVLFSGLAVEILYSNDFMPGVPFVALFVSVEVLGLVAGTYQAVLIAMEHIRYYVAQNVVAQLLTCVVAIAAIPQFGIAGAASAMFAGHLVILIGTVWHLTRRHGLKPPRGITYLCAYIFLVLGGAGALATTFPNLTVFSVTVRAVFFLTAAIVLTLFLDGDDWSNLRRLVGRSERTNPPPAP